MGLRRGVIGAAALCALVLPGCGDDESSPSGMEAPGAQSVMRTAPTPASRPLSPAGMAVIQRARDAVDAHCREVADALARGTSPPQASFERATVELDELAELAAEQPDAEAEDGTTPRLALGDIAENLEGTNCDSRLVAQIDEALAGFPAD